MGVGRKVISELRTHQKDEERDDQTPRQQAACELNGGEANANNVTHAKVRGTDARRRKRTRATSSKYLCVAGSAKPHLASPQVTDLVVNVLIGCEKAEAAE